MTFSKSVFKVARIILFAVILLGSARAFSDSSKQMKMLQMLDQLDQLDKMDMEDALYDAESCIIKRNFPGARSAIKRAKEFAHTDEDEVKIRATQTMLDREVSEKEREDREKRRRRKQAEQEEEEREERERKRRKAEKRAEREAREERYQNQPAEKNGWMSALNDGLDQMNSDLAQLQREQDATNRETNRLLAEQRQQNEEERREDEMEARREREDREQEDRRREEQAERRRQERQQDLQNQRERQAREKEARDRRNNAVTKSSAKTAGPMGLAIVWQTNNGNWSGHGPTQRLSASEKTSDKALDMVAGASTKFLCNMNISVRGKTRNCEVYRVNKEVDTTDKTSWTHNIRFDYPELKRLKSMGLD